MNIFVINRDPGIAARQLCDKHVVKMVTETSQMMASALIRYDIDSKYLPLTKSGKTVKGGYNHHPCTRWAGDTRSNFMWIAEHGVAMCDEYSRRYGRVHHCDPGIRSMASHANLIPPGDLDKFPVAISDDKKCRTIPGFNKLDVVTQYRLYYKLDKPFAEWNKRPGAKPVWFDRPVEKII